jgi:hypothetical protein
MERGCVEDQPQHPAKSRTPPGIRRLLRLARRAQPRSGIFRQAPSRNDAVARSLMVDPPRVGQAASLSRISCRVPHCIVPPGNARRRDCSSTSCRVRDRLEACPTFVVVHSVEISTAWFRLVRGTAPWRPAEKRERQVIAFTRRARLFFRFRHRSWRRLFAFIRVYLWFQCSWLPRGG